MSLNGIHERFRVSCLPKAAAVAEEDRCRIEIEAQEAEDGAGEDRSHQRGEFVSAPERDEEDRQR